MRHTFTATQRAYKRLASAGYWLSVLPIGEILRRLYYTHVVYYLIEML